MNAAARQRPIGFKPGEISACINQDIIQQHADEAAFQWLIRNSAITAANYNLNDLVDLDERVEANLDGLRIALDDGWRACEEQLAFEEPGEVFTAGVLAFESSRKERIETVLEVAGNDALLAGALVSALGWISYQPAEPLIFRLTDSEAVIHRRIGIGAFAVQRRDPGPRLIKAVQDDEAIVRARALKAVGELGRVDLLQEVISHTSDNDEACHFYAAWSAALTGCRDEAIIAMLGDYVVLASDYAEQALSMILRCMPPEEAGRLYQKLRMSARHTRLAAMGAGIIGDPRMVYDLIEFMRLDDAARVAGEAFEMITGVDLEYSDLDLDALEVMPETSGEDSEDGEEDPDADLPYPNADTIAQWWQDNQNKYKPGTRHILGLPLNQDSLKKALRKGNQRQRRAAALELALTSPGQALFEVRAPGKRQIGLLKI